MEAFEGRNLRGKVPFSTRKTFRVYMKSTLRTLGEMVMEDSPFTPLLEPTSVHPHTLPDSPL